MVNVMRAAALLATTLSAALLGACSTMPLRVLDTDGYYPDPTYLPVGAVRSGGVFRQAGDDISMSCTIFPMPAFSVAQCVGGGFPYTVPEGKTFCLTHMYLQNKYAWNPPRYGGNMHAVYLQEEGIPSASSHHPELHFNPPVPLPAGYVLKATVSNGQTEGQNVWAFEQGFLVDAGKPCKRL